MIALFLGKDRLHPSLIFAAILVLTGVYLVSAAPSKTEEKMQN
jgi:drug/metabolite transporter (DMT)-like permease